MTSIAYGTSTIPAAAVGAPSPYPQFVGRQNLVPLDAIGDLPVDMQERIRYGRITHPLPYATYDEYTRSPEPTSVATITMDNGLLRATVLPDFGGRIWSLRDLRADRELLFQPSAIQPANFGLTGAWFAGGIEYNVGATGHTPWSMQPVNAAIVGDDTVRLWEWERIRGMMVRIDLTLPTDSPHLYARVEIVNPDPEPKPLYWWTNIAVPQDDLSRVIAPSSSAWYSAYTGGLRRCTVPRPTADELAEGEREGLDISYPAQARFARDYFFEIASEELPFEGIVDGFGAGFAFSSTRELPSRKLFLWGEGPGGQRWQHWLNDSAGGGPRRYVEIQAGLVPTQSEHTVLPARSAVSWVESYGAVAMDAAVAHGDWNAAVGALREQVAGRTEMSAVASSAAAPRVVHRGSGWAAADLAVRAETWPQTLPEEFDGLPLPPLDPGVLAAVASPWESPSAPFVPPTGARWTRMWERAVADAPNWWTWFALATSLHADGRIAEAAEGYRRSLECRETAVAWRGAALAESDSRSRAAAFGAALRLDPQSYPLRVEAATDVIGTDPEAALRILDDAPDTSPGRITVLRALALSGIGEQQAARDLLATPVEVPDLREGETLVGDAWWAAFGTENELPSWADFRMTPARPADPAPID
ncbi:DUF5107 domain-containing protein [Tsukamurella strandjordii]|uniref:DUF5107 domain-containing protein n=1 Tax=Tsukamurella TaxID=2060 RepID=UPI001C7DBE6E|nr:DUF5107 domain-containing protein [Tsukamurella sp. TY48]GIZ96864.1 hypothetical protein TTY48_14760 [Tsukamurella sp. TY48]